ncbi:hypothetical protein BH23ACT6_BH23ACT6_14430 [soil metagenome]
MLRGAVGSVVGIGLLAHAGSATATATATATPRFATRSPGPTADDVTELQGGALIDAAHAGLDTPDLVSVADARSLTSSSSAFARSGAPRAISRGTLRKAAETTGRAAPPSGELEVYGVRADRGRGVTKDTILYY